MALLEEGWPLGLGILNGMIGLVENDSDFSGPMLTASPTSSTHSSSDLESQSTGSFFHDKTTTLGTLIGDSSILEPSQRSNRRTIMVDATNDNKKKKHNMMKPWLFSFCSKLTTDAVSVKDAPSLGHYLEAERRAASTFRMKQCPISSIHGSHGISPTQCSDCLSSGSLRRNGRKEPNTALLEQNNGHADR